MNLDSSPRVPLFELARFCAMICKMNFKLTFNWFRRSKELELVRAATVSKREEGEGEAAAQ